MLRILGMISVVVVTIIGTGCTQAPAGTMEVTVYKSATCGCCNKWINHLEAHGFAVKAHNVENLDKIKRQNGVSPQISACHTARVGNYVIEGHVPARDIKRLLAQKLTVTGLTVPGMPTGSPGMEGASSEPYNVYTFDRNGNTTVFARY